MLSMGRKNAKTAFSAFLLLLHLAGPEAKANSQLYSAAQSREQAAVLFELAAKIVRMSPDLAQYITIRDTAKQLLCAEIGTTYKALSAEASTAHGLSPAFVVHDELGQVRGPKSALYDALETAAGAQESPISIVISTQAPTDADLFSILIDDAKGGQDPRTKLVLYTADELLDPFSDEAIRQANPHFDAFMNKEEVRDQAEIARRMPSAENAYRNLVLNQRVTVTSPLFSANVWESCSGEVSEDVFRTQPVYIGLDLSFVNDLTAAVAVAKDADGIWHVRPMFFAPQTGCAERSHRDRVPYDVWAREGKITLTPGASVDYAYVARALGVMADSMRVIAIAFDRWGIKFLEPEIARLDRVLPMREWGQGYQSMSPSITALESEVLNGRLRHGGHPVLRMCAANAIVKMDEAGNRKLDKSKSNGRIDGIVALAMAMGCAASDPAMSDPTPSIRFL
jgi:phage terminase large subunit-like protein